MSTETALPLVNKRLVAAHIAAGFAYFFVALFAGLLYALQLTQDYPFPGIELLSPGRIRMLHTNAVAFGFLINLFIASLNWIIPRLTGHRVLSRKTLQYMTVNHLPNAVDMSAISSPQYSEIAAEGVGFGLGFSVVIDSAKAGTS